MVEYISTVAVLVIIFTTYFPLVIPNSRGRIWLLAGQYFGVFLLLQKEWPFNLASASLLSGWMAAAVLGMAQESSASDSARPDRKPETWKMDQMITLLVGLFVIIVSISFALTLTGWLPDLHWASIFCGFMLIGFSLLQTAFQQSISCTITALIGSISGFWVLISGLTSSIFVVGLLAFSTLLLALTGAFLLQSGRSEGGNA